METVKIRVLKDGPYLITGPVEILDAEGQPVPQPERGWALCRCGGSLNKPFCDGTHSKTGFKGAAEAVREAEAVNTAEAKDSPSLHEGNIPEAETET